MGYREIAEAILAEIGYTLADVTPRGRKARRRGHHLSRYSGTVYPAKPGEKHPIQITFPVDCPIVLWIVAHEVGHIKCRHLFTSVRDYIKEYQAERYAEEALRRHGYEPHPFLIESAKKNVRAHCWMRQHIMGESLYGDPYAWAREIVEWCEFTPKHGELYV